MEAEQSKNIARIILAPILKQEEESSHEEDDGEDSISAEDEFMAARLISALEKKDKRTVVKILRSLQR